MTTLSWRLAALALLLGLAVSWEVQGWRYGRQLAEQAQQHTQERETAATAVIGQMTEQQAQREALEARLAAQSQTHYKEMENAKSDRQRLRDRLATADLRLSVLVAGTAEGGQRGVPGAAGSGGVVHGPARAELDSAHAQRILGITGDGDDGLRALAACQGYVREMLDKNGRSSGYR